MLWVEVHKTILGHFKRFPKIGHSNEQKEKDTTFHRNNWNTLRR